MHPLPQQRLAEWLRASRGPETQEHLAEDITRVTGWQIDRTRYSRYESGKLAIGKQTLAHFVDYWASRGVAGPDSMPSSPTPHEGELGALIAAQTRALEAQTAAFLTLAASIDRAAEGVTGRVEDFGSVLADVLRAVQSPAKGENGDAADTAPARSRGPGR